ncbi:hypothetical protein PCASD_11351 [Puccinia coronata f. sp. avenae]|uniref:Uncharacterized protein n=1 Tax=Puccinia coronata f. sp. avenae TaxID=200324 RepID=A0A2N5UFX4_9BASI|nr:hypothetical protein PCASD_11351 [Puccinia coronata f. sp. avenae]
MDTSRLWSGLSAARCPKIFFRHLRITSRTHAQICHTTMSTGLPLVHWLGRTITPAYQRLVLGPIWLALVDPLDRTGISVAGVGTCLDSTQPALASLLLCILPGISTGRISVFPSVPQQSTLYCMTVVRTAKAPYKPAPYPYQSTISRAYCRRNRTSLVMNPPSAAYPAVVQAPPTAAPTTNAPPPPFEDVYFDSNGVLFRNGVAIVNQHGSIICRSIVERPLPVFCPPLVEPETLVIPGYPRGPVPPGLESLVEHLHHNGQGANNASKDAQMSSVSMNRGRLVGDTARIAKATRVFNKAHDIIVDHFYNTTAPPAPRSASEPRTPTTDPVDTDSDPADAQSEPLLTNNQGNPTTIDSTTIKSTTSLGAITSRPDSIVSPLVLSILPISTNPPCPPWYQTTPDSLLATELSAPIACRPSSLSPAAIICSIELCAANNLRAPTGLSTTSYELQG